MPNILRWRFILAVFTVIGVAACGSGGDPELARKVAAHEGALRELPRGFYEPGLGDLMHALQLRHAKLWFAGEAGNWELADFELHEIHENLDRVARWHADSTDVPMAPSIKAYTQSARYALEQSIDRRDRRAFGEAFDAFTEGCNACHRAAKHGFIVIQRPTAEPYGNQIY